MVPLLFLIVQIAVELLFLLMAQTYFAALQLGIEIDYTKLLCYLTAGSRCYVLFSIPE